MSKQDLLAAMDFSTIRLDVLKKLSTEHFAVRSGEHIGSSCFLDAPGFPSYFLQSITGLDDDGPEYAVVYRCTAYALPRLEWQHDEDAEDHSRRFDDLLKRLWRPLPIEHERTQLWMAHCYRHFHRCYYDETAEKQDDRLLIYPVPYYKLQRTRIDDRWRDEVIAAYKAADEAANASIEARAAALATPDRHIAVRRIRQFYPEYAPNLEWIATPPDTGAQDDWWERYAAPFTERRLVIDTLMPRS